MALQYKYIERPKDANVCIELLEKDIMPLLTEHWDKYGKDFYGRPFIFNIEAFANLWLVSGLVVVVAYDDDKAVGLFIGILFTPMMFNTRVLQVETCYGKSDEVERGIYNYIDSIGNILGYDELWVSNDTNKDSDAKTGKTNIGKFEMTRYRRG